MTRKTRRQKVTHSLLFFSGAVALAAVACVPPSPTSEKVRNTPEGAPCPGPEALIDDGEDNDNQNAVVEGRGGYWYTFVDDAGSTVWPKAGAHGGTFQMSEGGANGTKYAMRFKGQVAATGSVVFTGMGMNFVDPKGQYDTSKYKGISFYAKKGPDSTGSVRIKLPDKYTDPDGGVCTECYNDMGMDLTLTNEWQKFVIPFKALSQLPGWGSPRRMKIDQETMYGIQFQVNEKGMPYDIWIDELRFTGCAG